MASRSVKVTRQLAILRQVICAIAHLRHGELECAITLALAAEGQMPNTEKPHLYKQLRAAAPDLARDGTFNVLRDWLKHFHEDKPDDIEIQLFDVAIAVMRATTKFTAVYGKTHPEFEAFSEWCEIEGYKEKRNIS